ncbi:MULTISPECIES: TauD/TfdA family dioxygenase [unclassified Streptomyces]|uniref:TauD/TfdA family dioxygenase n=1 Tax=unclassified Streptomyces TaxID=2593676 RepID=UPI0036F75130
MTDGSITLDDCTTHGTFPLIVTANGVRDATGWAAAHAEPLRTALHHYGAVVLRGFPVPDERAFEDVVRALSGGSWAEYTERATPRSHVAGKVFTSTEYPPDRSIFVHNESSHVLRWPRHLYFWCGTPAQEGGETPVCDTRRVHRALDPALRERFTSEGWIYQRTFGTGIGFSWQSVYGVDTFEELEKYCADHHMAVRRDGDTVRVRYRRWAAIRHPRTGEDSWFNHGVFFNRWNLEPELQEFAEELGEDTLPYNTLYGDGSPIPREVIEEIRAAYDAATVAEPYRAGDVMVVDNIAVAHGRRPYRGQRRILVTMTDPTDGTAFAPPAVVATPGW